MQHDSITQSCTDSNHYKEVLKLIGDFWTLRVIAALESSDLRFCALERVLGDSNPATLTGRLKRLEGHGIVARRKDGEETVYTLTRRGAELTPIVRQIHEFAKS